MRVAAGATPRTFESHQVALFDPGSGIGGAPAPPMHRSAFDGGGLHPRGTSKAPSSPRYLQATRASTAHSSVRPGSSGTLDASLMRPAGGPANRSHADAIDFDPDEKRSSMRRSFSLPRRTQQASVANIASPSRAGTLESPRFSRDPALFAETSAASNPHGGCAGRPAVRPPLPPGAAATHDKTVPNSRRSQRGTGCCKHRPPLSSSAALATSDDLLAREAAFASNPLPRRGRGNAFPPSIRPSVDPIAMSPGVAGEGMPPPPPPPQRTSALASSSLRNAGYIGVESGSQGDNLLGGRRARGLCSPRPARSNPLTWD